MFLHAFHRHAEIHSDRPNPIQGPILCLVRRRAIFSSLRSARMVPVDLCKPCCFATLNVNRHSGFFHPQCIFTFPHISWSSHWIDPGHAAPCFVCIIAPRPCRQLHSNNCFSKMPREKKWLVFQWTKIIHNPSQVRSSIAPGRMSNFREKRQRFATLRSTPNARSESSCVSLGIESPYAAREHSPKQSSTFRRGITA